MINKQELIGLFVILGIVLCSSAYLIAENSYNKGLQTAEQTNLELSIKVATLEGQVAAMEEVKGIYNIAQQNVEQTRTLMIEHGKRRIELEELLKDERNKRENYQNQLHSVQAQLTAVRSQLTQYQRRENEQNPNGFN